MQIALLLSELEAQKELRFYSETVQLWKAQQHCVRQSNTPFTQAYRPVIFSLPVLLPQSISYQF